MNKLFVLLGPTAVGKTDLSLAIAQLLSCDIISCDSRQMFKEMKIGTAAPTKEQEELVKHHFIGNLSVTDNYNAGLYELDALKIIDEQIKLHGNAFLTGGSMLYIDAVCNGIDDIPTIDQSVRDQVNKIYENEGLEGVRQRLKILDPEHYMRVDLANTQRVKHALEICFQAGVPYSSLRTGKKKKRTFEIIKIGLEREREELYERINTRVDLMVQNGLKEEVLSLAPYKHLNALNSVGYKELFAFFDGEITEEKAIELIKRNSRRYAKKQLSWFKKNDDTVWFNANELQKVLDYIESKM